ncbi:hypothetical protein BJX62DRAFT_175113 [Aspergillus germanicus]
MSRPLAAPSSVNSTSVQIALGNFTPYGLGARTTSGQSTVPHSRPMGLVLILIPLQLLYPLAPLFLFFYSS